MDRKKAIEVLKPLVNSYVDYANITMKEEDDDIAEALEMAIDALTQSEIVRCGECGHKGTYNCIANILATLYGYEVKDDFYCGLAERRTDGEKQSD